MLKLKINHKYTVEHKVDKERKGAKREGRAINNRGAEEEQRRSRGAAEEQQRRRKPT